MPFNSFQAKGHFINYLEPVKNLVTHHYFCGSHQIMGASCPNCHKPLLRFLSINLADKRLSLTSSLFKNLPLFFCWTCNIAQELFYYKVINDSTINIIKYKKGGVETDFPYSDYPTFFPGRQAFLEEIPDNVQHILSRLNAREIDEADVMEQYPTFCKPRHQLGGEPYLIQPELSSVGCPMCKDRMPFLASIGDDCVDPRGFTGNEYVQVLFFYCKRCSVIGAFQQCD